MAHINIWSGAISRGIRLNQPTPRLEYPMLRLSQPDTTRMDHHQRVDHSPTLRLDQPL